MGIRISLTDYEVRMAGFVGVTRFASGMNRQDRFHNPLAGWDTHLDAACGEIAVAKLLDKYWDGSQGTFHNKPDLSGDTEVRGGNTDCLIIRQSDLKNPKARFVRVQGKAPHFIVHGWLPLNEAVQPKYMREYPGEPASYWVPNEELRDIETFYDEVNHGNV